MPGLEPRIQGQRALSKRHWIAGSSPAMTSKMDDPQENYSMLRFGEVPGCEGSIPSAP
jgi:hypothetical protein